VNVKKEQPVSGQRWRDPFVIVLALAFLLRLAWALAVPVKPVSDGAAYDLFAQHLAKGLGYCWTPGIPTGNYPVGTSFIYSLFYRAFGVSYLPIVIFNLLISLGIIWLSMVLAQRWFNRKVAVFAGVLSALWPVQIEFTSVLASELIFIVLLLALLTIWESRRFNPWVKAVLVGLACAALCYIRPVALLLPALLCGIRELRIRRIAMPLATTAVTYFVMALAIAPWAIRNTRIFGHLEIISTNGGQNFWMGNNPTGNGETEEPPPEAYKLQEGDRDLYLTHIANAYIHQYPGQFVVRTVKKLFWLHDHETIGVHWNAPSLESAYGARTVWWLKLISDLYWWVVLALALGGAWILIVQRGVVRAFTHAPVIILWMYFAGVHAVIVVQDRYHMPCIPFIGMLAAVALVAIREKVPRLRAMPTL